MKNAPLMVIALGGNSMLNPEIEPTIIHQFETTSLAMHPIAELTADGTRIVLTHGNGPQVGYMQLRSELASDELHTVPLDSLVADSQGSLGYMIGRTLSNNLALHGRKRAVCCIITEVEISPDDPALRNPTKPIGKFYSKEETQKRIAERGWKMVEDSGRGWRRVVPSPKPVRIVQLETIKHLVDAGVIVIACGGGGIPVVKAENGKLIGIPAVIDKDRASALLANQLGASTLVITTGVNGIMKGFQTEQPQMLVKTNITQLRKLHAAGEFPPGSMGPKVEAAIYFLENGGSNVIICRPCMLTEALAGRAGTIITK